MPSDLAGSFLGDVLVSTVESAGCSCVHHVGWVSPFYESGSASGHFADDACGPTVDGGCGVKAAGCRCRHGNAENVCCCPDESV